MSTISLATLESDRLAAKAAFLERIEKFKSSDPAGKRVMIAQDVIDQVLAKKYVPQAGVWARIELTRRAEENEQVCDLISAPGVECTCCALGAMMLSEIGINDDLNAGQVDIGDERVGIRFRGSKGGGHRLEEFFDYDQLQLIEIAFELGNGEWSQWSLEEREPGDRAVDFGCAFGSKDKRLIAIMENIITNNGKFVP